MNELFQLLPKLLRKFDDNPNVREAVIFAAWRKIAGESLAEHAVASRLEQKRLTVAVSSLRWAKYLKDLSGQMIFKLNSALKQASVTYIEFEVDEETVLAYQEKHRGNVFDEHEFYELASKQITPKLEGEANSILDENLRRQFLLAAGNCLARKEKLKKI